MPEPYYGVLVNCDPGADPPLDKVCMKYESWACSLDGYYLREGLCAYVLGGTPEDYDGKPKAVDENFNCLSEDPGFQNAIGENNAGCSACGECGLQLGGIQEYEYGLTNPPGWDELDCPNLGDFNDFCEPPEPTEGGEDDEGGDTDPTGMHSSVWICNGSNSLEGIYNDGEPDEKNVLMSGNLSLPDCRTATDESDARARCTELCDWKNEAYQMEADNNSATWSPFDCEYFDTSNPPPVEIPPNGVLSDYCSNGGPMDFPPNPLVFSGNAVLDFFSGDATAESSQWSGLLDFKVLPGCGITNTVCAMEIAEIRATSASIRGVYEDNVMMLSLPFEILNPDIQLVQPITGYVIKSSGDLFIPSQPISLRLSIGTTIVDGSPAYYGPEISLIPIGPPVGNWDGTNLELAFSWGVSGLDFSLSMLAN